MLHAWYLVGSAHFALYYSVKFQFYDIFISNIFRKPHCSISSHAECTKQQRARTSALVASIHMHIAYMHTTHTYIYIMMRPPMAGHRQQLNFWVIYINAFERWKYVDYLFVWNEFLGRACLNVDSFSFRCGLFCYFFFSSLLLRLCDWRRSQQRRTHKQETHREMWMGWSQRAANGINRHRRLTKHSHIGQTH